MRVSGRCHCGEIRYEAEADPKVVGICHCTDCQMLTGSVYRVTVPVTAESFVLHGQPKTYVKTADSGTKRRHAFCGGCGSPVYATADIDEPVVYSLRAGCLDQRRELRPMRQQWCDSALDFAFDLAPIPRVARQ